jgi:hypothetical protein
MSFEQIIAVSVGLIALPIFYWWGFKLAFKEGVDAGMREMARMRLDEETEFDWLMVEYQTEILEKRMMQKLYGDE